MGKEYLPVPPQYSQILIFDKSNIHIFDRLLTTEMRKVFTKKKRIFTKPNIVRIEARIKCLFTLNFNV